MEYEWISLMNKIRDRVNYADKKHPEGAKFSDLMSEIDEVSEAIKAGDDAHTVYEIFDVITVCVRMLRRYDE